MFNKWTIGCFFILMAFGSRAQTDINTKAVYNALASDKVSVVDAQLRALQILKTGHDKDAFEGALLMRKAGLVAIPAKKLSFFKQGNKKLENAISADKHNAGYRFLRLMIQENAPNSLGYNKNIAEDSQQIKVNYKSLPATTQQAIVNYSKKSKALPSSAL